MKGTNKQSFLKKGDDVSKSKKNVTALSSLTLLKSSMSCFESAMSLNILSSRLVNA